MTYYFAPESSANGHQYCGEFSTVLHRVIQSIPIIMEICREQIIIINIGPVAEIQTKKHFISNLSVENYNKYNEL